MMESEAVLKKSTKIIILTVVTTLIISACGVQQMPDSDEVNEDELYIDNPFRVHQNESGNDSYTEVVLIEVSKLFYLTKDEVLNTLGDHYKIVPAGAEHMYDGCYYEDYGITIVFDDLDERNAPYQIELIECDNTVEIKGTRIGMTFSEILTYLPDSKIHDLRPNFLEYYHPMFSLTCPFDNIYVWFGAVEAAEWVDTQQDLDMNTDKTIELQIRRNHMFTVQ